MWLQAVRLGVRTDLRVAGTHFEGHGPFSRFEMHRSREISVDGVKMGSDMLTMDKPALIKEMNKGALIKQGQIDLDAYDRIIDATGVSMGRTCPR